MILQDLCENLGRIRARSCKILDKILWDHGKILQDSSQDPVGSWQDLAGFFTRSCGIMARSCKILGKILWDHGKILQDSWQDPVGSCQFLAGSWQDPVRTCKDLARSLHDLAGFMSRSWQDHGRILAKILARSYGDLGKIVNLGLDGIFRSHLCKGYTYFHHPFF